MLNFISPYATQFTREKAAGKRNPQVSMWNRKPYRTKALKQRARDCAAKGSDGAYHSPVPTLMHPALRHNSSR